MLTVSLTVSPSDWDSFKRSLPARSTKASLPRRIIPVSESAQLV